MTPSPDPNNPYAQPSAAPPAAAPGQNLPPVPNANQPQPDPRVTRLEQELQETRRLATNLQSVLARTVNPNQPDPAAQRTNFYQDPVGSTTAIAQQAAREMAERFGAGHMETLISVARNQVRAQDPELFDRYANEIESNVQRTDPQFHGNINVWQSAFNLAKGAHLSEIREQIRQERPQTPAVHISREGGPAPANVPPGPAQREQELSPEEKKMAAKLNITEDMYRAGKKYNDDQTDLDFNPLGPSAWDKVITFDSKQKRREARANANNNRAA